MDTAGAAHGRADAQPPPPPPPPEPPPTGGASGASGGDGDHEAGRAVYEGGWAVAQGTRDGGPPVGQPPQALHATDGALAS
eukprot:4852878-Pleurochrysis_carterae.AAC.1